MAEKFVPLINLHAEILYYCLEKEYLSKKKVGDIKLHLENIKSN